MGRLLVVGGALVVHTALGMLKLTLGSGFISKLILMLSSIADLKVSFHFKIGAWKNVKYGMDRDLKVRKSSTKRVVAIAEWRM